MGRETTYPAKKQELFYFDEKKDVYKPLTENGAIPVVIKGGNVGGGTGAASTGEVTIKNDKLVVQLADKSLETKVTNASLDVNVLNPTKAVDATIINKSVDVKVLNPATETTIKNKSIDVNVLNPVAETTIKNKTLNVNVAKSEPKVTGLFGGKVVMESHEPSDDSGLLTDFIEASNYSKLALTSIISGKGAGGDVMTTNDILQFNSRLETFLEWSHDGISTHGITPHMGMTQDDVVIKVNGKYVDILSKYVRVKVRSTHGGEWKPVMEMSLVLK